LYPDMIIICHRIDVFPDRTILIIWVDTYGCMT
jgi:hypothetical protein